MHPVEQTEPNIGMVIAPISVTYNKVLKNVRCRYRIKKRIYCGEQFRSTELPHAQFSAIVSELVELDKKITKLLIKNDELTFARKSLKQIVDIAINEIQGLSE